MRDFKVRRQRNKMKCEANWESLSSISHTEISTVGNLQLELGWTNANEVLGLEA